MVNKHTPRDDGPRSTVGITCFAPNAREITLVGSFNDWDPGALRMTKSADGQWSADLQLPPGRYEYKFVVDGIACSDPHLKNGGLHCKACAPQACGELNRILWVR